MFIFDSIFCSFRRLVSFDSSHGVGSLEKCVFDDAVCNFREEYERISFHLFDGFWLYLKNRKRFTKN